MAKSYFEVDGLGELKRSIRRLENVPQKHVTASARKGMNIVLKDAKAHAPVDEGNLQKAMKLQGEKSRYKSKKVYKVVWDSLSGQYNDIFQKPVKNVGESGNPNAKDIAYYPASQEYGYFLRNGKFMPGIGFVHEALSNNAPTVRKVMITTMKTKIDQEIMKAGLK